MGREKKKRWGCFGNTVHLTFMPIKQTKLNWAGRERERECWETESRGREQRERKERETSAVNQYRQEEQNKTYLPTVWHSKIQDFVTKKWHCHGSGKLCQSMGQPEERKMSLLFLIFTSHHYHYIHFKTNFFITICSILLWCVLSVVWCVCTNHLLTNFLIFWHVYVKPCKACFGRSEPYYDHSNKVNLSLGNSDQEK